jgi:hypothetical protein
MVFVAGSAEIRNACSGTLGASERQPVVSAALQRLMLVTDRMFAPPALTTYSLPVQGASVKKVGNELNPGPWSGVACWFGGRVRQPEVTLPWQVLVLIADNVSSTWLMVNAVCTRWPTATNWGPAPVVTVGGARRQPAVTRALHRRR